MDVYETGIEYIVAKGPTDQAINILVSPLTPGVWHELTLCSNWWMKVIQICRIRYKHFKRSLFVHRAGVEPEWTHPVHYF